MEKLKKWRIFPISVSHSYYKCNLQHIYGKEPKTPKLLLLYLNVFDEIIVLDESDNFNDTERFSEKLEDYSDYEYELSHASSLGSSETINSQKTLECFAIPKVLEVT